MLRMLGDRIAVREDSNLHQGLIFAHEVDDGFVKHIVHGNVVAVGPGRVGRHGKLMDMWGIKAGDRIAYSPVTSQKQTVDGEELTFIRLDSVVGVE